MADLDVRIVRLEPMRVASALGFGTNPEEQAWAKILAWARDHGALDQPGGVRFFGFNNPDPTPGSPNYGYEQWITLDQLGEKTGENATGAAEVTFKGHPGGMFAVTRCTLVDITEKWHRLLAWCEASPYRMRHAQYLEEALTPNLEGDLQPETFFLDLYMPIAE